MTNKLMKRIVAFLLCITLMTGVLPVTVWAEGNVTTAPRGVGELPPTISAEWTNPLYNSDEDMPEFSEGVEDSPFDDVEEKVYYKDPAAAAAAIKEDLKARKTSVVIGYEIPVDQYNAAGVDQLFYAIKEALFVHTGVSNEGDYLRWSISRTGIHAKSIEWGKNYKTYLCDVTLTFEYNDSAECEAEVAKAEAQLLNELKPSGSDYEKIKTVYDWMCANIRYDNDNLKDETYLLKHSAYAALVNKTSVCQGYALLLYRLALKMGIDCRIITGLGSGGDHAWNILKLDGAYYNVDATWDAAWKQAGLDYPYFLTTDANFGDHVRGAEYATAAFYAAYPMGVENFVLGVANGTCGKNLTWQLDVLGTLTIVGTGEMENYSQEPGKTAPWSGYSIEKVIVADNVTSIGNEAFYNMTELTDVVIGKNVAKIGMDAFSGCDKLSDVYYAGDAEAWEGLTGAVSEAVRIHYKCNDTQGHWDIETVAPTCVEDGYVERFCDCGFRVYVDVDEAALGHDFTVWTVTKEPTTIAEGERTATCQRKNCGYVTTETVAKKVLDVPVVKVSNDAASGKIKLSWTKITDASKYEIYYATSKNGTYSKLTTATGTSLTHTKAETGKTYYYKVRCVDALGTKSDFSDKVNRTCDLARPEVSISNDAATGKIKLSWNKITGASKYEIYYATSKTGTYSKLTTANGTSLTHSKAETGKTYYYKVKAIHSTSAANSAESAVVNRTCDLARPEVSVTNDAATGKNKLSWNKITGASKYEIYYATSKTGTYSKLTTVTGTSLTHTKAEAGKTYYYKVKAIHSASAANSAESAIVSRTCDLARPDVTATNVGSSGKIKLTWEKITGASKYEIYRATSKTGTYSKLTTVTGTSYTDADAAAGKTYYYKVKAIHKTSAANSAESAIVKATCDLARPDVTAKLSSGKIKLSWKKIEGAKEYKVYRATSKTGTYKAIKTTTSLSYTDKDVKSGKTYYYKVVAVHSTSAANSAYSSIDSVKVN